jgi:hypothetical protein
VRGSSRGLRHIGGRGRIRRGYLGNGSSAFGIDTYFMGFGVVDVFRDDGITMVEEVIAVLGGLPLCT